VKKSEQTVYIFTMGVTNKRTTTKTRRKIRDVDQIQNDLASKKHLGDFQNTKAPEDLPGLGRHYCVECAKWFDTDATLVAHRRGKPHKRRYVSHNAYRLVVQPYS
jgi:bud site selection protein 20